MTRHNRPDAPLAPDFLEQIAGSFGVGAEDALALLGTLLTSYEPTRRYEILSISSIGISETG